MIIIYKVIYLGGCMIYHFNEIVYFEIVTAVHAILKYGTVTLSFFFFFL